MKTVDYIKQNDGNIIVGKLAENLTVAGTYHGLNDDDKKLLEELVDKSEFVATEEWKVPKTTLMPFSGTFKWDNVLQEFRCSYSNMLYLAKILRWFENKNKKGVKAVANLTGVQRDWKQSEFEYCKKLAKDKGKEFYVADMTIADLFNYLLKEKKGRGIMPLFTATKKDFQEALNKVSHLSEATILQVIRAYEGPISQLARPGLLVVGTTHAVNYLNGKHSELLQ